ncbi:diacylglycerol O-acyltransferase [Actinoallomurus iriomotensis]|uniref:Diacylglycerol O-acyltransferase n=2 Tax=Actinoallomurus iriomotensis TaxID=478107 RepID=A0A9W6S141_9ACTN|nr:diacylglycerol O-acyltransferase [Actinoallomurus iriomotensis]
MQRMSGIDAGMFFAENETRPLQIASVSVFDGPAPTYGEFVRALVARLLGLPRFRQRVRRVPLDLGRPVWVDDPHFQLLYHVRHTAVPAPGGAEELRNLAGRVLGQRLDLSRPLWEMWLVEGLEEDRWAIISKVHHCMVDGVGGSDLMTSLFDLSPGDAPVRDERGPIPLPEAEPEPSRPSLVLAGVVGTTMEQLRQVARLPELTRHSPATARFVRGLPAYARRLREGRGASSLNGPTSPHRRWAWTEADLGEARRISDALGGTVNDVVLAAVARGFRDLLAERDELRPDTVVRTLVPVSVRLPDEKGTLTNRVSGVLVSLPCGRPDPLCRHELICRQTTALKASHQAVGPTVFTRMLGLAPNVLAVAARTALRMRQPYIQTITTNVPGPPVPLYAMGRRLAAIYPYVPLAAGIRVSTGVVSYLDTLYLGITGDFDAMPDIELFSRGVRHGFDELAEAVSPDPAVV